MAPQPVPTAGLRHLAARGTLINGAFQIGLTTLGLLKGWIVAVFLTREDFGVWGVLAVALGTLLWLKQVGIGDKYVQQDEDDQELAFQKAFTLELMFSGLFLLLVLAAAPVVALVYGEWKLLAPALVVSASIIGVALQAPIWPYYRSMDFLRQRLLQSVDPVASFVLTVALAIAGLGYWSLVVGAVAGSWMGAVVAVVASPYRLRLRYDRGALREYASFSWPLLISGGAGVLIAQSSTLVANWELGLAGVGAVALASSIVAYANRVDEVVTATLYPAICRRVEQLDVLRESFLKTNRLALLWGLPCGIGVALFARPLLEHVLGDRWLPALGLLQAFAVIAAVNQVGFNWTAFYRARGDTRPIATTNVVMLVVFLGVAIPLLVRDGLSGLAVGMAVTTAVGIALRLGYLRRLFPGLPLARHVARAAAPTLPAAAVVLGLRAMGGIGALPELVLFAAIVAGVTWALERQLFAELAGYLGSRRAATSAISEPATRAA